MKIVRVKSINYTDAVMLATKAWLELNSAGIGENVASIHWEQKGIVAYTDDGVPVGVITWTHQPSLKAVYAEMAFVEPKYRRQGVFALMWADLVEQAKELDVLFIRLGTHHANSIARGIYERAGGKITAIFFEFAMGEKP